jgi:SAM-dependent methyltransferase
MGNLKAAGLPLGVGLLSASLILLEVLLTRLFSVSLYYHFAFLAVSVAMLGLGGGGLLVYLNRQKFARERVPDALALLGVILAGLMTGALLLVLNLAAPADVSWDTASAVILIFLVGTLPFLSAGAALALLNWYFADRIHRVYSYDLCGAALGGLAVLPALEWLGAPKAVVGAAALAATSAALLGWATGARRALRWLGLGAGAALVFLLISNWQGNLLDLRYAKGVSVADEIYARWNAISRVCVHPAEETYAIRIDCDAATGVPSIDFDRADRAKVAADFSRRGEDLAHVLRPGGTTLVIGSGGGRDVARALAHGSPRVVAVEINPLIARDLMLGFLREYSRGLFARPEVELVVDDARSAIQRNTERFDVMQSTLIDTWASTAAGAFALSESYLYTLEAFQQYLGHLKPDGILIVTRWEFVPPRQALRVVSLGRAAMERDGVRDPTARFVVVQDGVREPAIVSVLMKNSPFTPEELACVEAFLAANPRVKPVYVPGRRMENAFSDLLHAPRLDAFAAAYPFDVSPTVDAKPFFFFTTRWSRMLEVFHGSHEDVKNNVAVFLLAVLAVLSSLGVAALLWLPRWFAVGDAGEKGFRLYWAYFLAIGVAFIVVEIALIQKFILFLGHPTYGITVVVASLLLGSGLGSRLSGRLRNPRKVTQVLPPTLAGWIAVLMMVLLPAVLPLAQPFGRGLRIAVAVVLLAPLGFVMGMPYPSCVRALPPWQVEALPWFWSANAAGSVLGSVLAICLAIAVGIPMTGAIGGAAYVFAAGCAYFGHRAARL